MKEQKVKKINKKYKRKMAICQNSRCKKRSNIKNLFLFQDMYYIPPFSCVSGDYWIINKNITYFICPHCNYINKNYYWQDDMKVLYPHKFFKDTIYIYPTDSIMGKNIILAISEAMKKYKDKQSNNYEK